MEDYIGDYYIGAIKGYTRSLDNGSYKFGMPAVSAGSDR